MMMFLLITKTDIIILEEHEAFPTIIEGNYRANSFLNAIVTEKSKENDLSKILKNVCN